MSTVTRRLFFALWPGDAVRHALFHWQTRNLPAEVRWTHREDLHLTLHFLGAVDEVLLDDLRRLGEGVAGRRFMLELDRIGHWPRPQVLWAGPGELPDGLVELHRALAAGLQALGLETERRRYQPHVTLARKVRARAAWPPLPPIPWEVEELALVESRAGAAPHYQPIARWAMD